MRGLIPDLPTPHPFGPRLPSVFQEDPVTMRLVGAMDDVLAPIIGTLDSLYAYLDPRLTPTDFLDWLAGWVGVEPDENWPLSRQRALVAAAVELHRVRGTVTGLREYLELATGGSVEITDSGGTGWSNSPDADLPGDPVPRLAVRVRLPAGAEPSRGVVEDLVAAAKPVHVAHRVTVETAPNS